MQHVSKYVQGIRCSISRGRSYAIFQNATPKKIQNGNVAGDTLTKTARTQCQNAIPLKTSCSNVAQNNRNAISKRMKRTERQWLSPKRMPKWTSCTRQNTNGLRTRISCRRLLAETSLDLLSQAANSLCARISRRHLLA